MLDVLAEAQGADLSIGAITRLQRLKTGALISFACTSGAILGKAAEPMRNALLGYAHDLGLAFQIVDDLLDVEGDVADTAAEIDDQIGVVPGLGRNGLGGKTGGGITTAQERLLRGFGDFAEGIKASARGFENVGGFLEGDGFSHGAATGVAEADEQHAEFLSRS